MVVFIVHIDGVLAFKAEGYAPIATDSDGPCTFSLAFEFMEIQTRQIHILW
jgi:hypothetical protein